VPALYEEEEARENIFCALKLEMKKAFDRLEWDYLQKIMLKHVFHRLTQ
jgi:hypothetical protein